jgi:6-phosphofructokinase 1
MEKKDITIAILTGGGDCPGLNAVIRAWCLTAFQKYKAKCIGFKDGFEGLYEMKYRPLNLQDINDILNIGGTILGTTNIGHFRLPLDKDVVSRCVENYNKLNISCLVCCGGDGTMSIAYMLGLASGGIIKYVGVPKTIDNDLRCTDQTFGFDSAVSIVTESLDRIHTTASSHHRVMVVEVMGRNAGWIALASAIAGGAHVVLIPEIPFKWSSVFDFLRARHSQGSSYTIIVVSEGVRIPETETQIGETVNNSNSSIRLGGIGYIISQKITDETKIETRCTVLGYVQRGGTPTSYDRILATKYGAKAAELACEGHYGLMVSLKGTDIVTVQITGDMQEQKLVNFDNQLIWTARSLGISFGD